MTRATNSNQNLKAADTNRTSGPLDHTETALWAAVLARAIQDALTCKRLTDPDVVWFGVTTPSRAFENVAMLAGLDPDAVWPRVRAMLEAEAGTRASKVRNIGAAKRRYVPQRITQCGRMAGTAGR